MSGTVIDGQDSLGRMLQVGFGATVTLMNLTLRGGKAWEAQDGGGIYNQGTLILDHVTVNANQTSSGGGPVFRSPGAGRGGGIYNDNGVVALHESAVYGNASGRGGAGGAGGYGSSWGGLGGEGGQGGFVAGLVNNGTLTVINTTINDNAAGNGGPGAAGGPSGTPGGAGTPGSTGIGGIGGVIYQGIGQAVFQESTVAAKVDGTGETEGVHNAGIFVYAGELTEIDTIVSQDDCYANSATGGEINDGLVPGDGHLNLTWPTTRCPGILANPLLGPLASHGGPTQTMAITPPSPAIGRIPPGGTADCTPTDQRGIPRPQPPSGRCDIGAYQYQP